jgi:hypothetical protein
MTLNDDGSVTLAPDASSSVANEPLPPFATKLTVTADVEVEIEPEVDVGVGVKLDPVGTLTHSAYSVSLEATWSNCAAAYSVPEPLASVFHPANEYPLRDSPVPDGRAIEVPDDSVRGGSLPMPPLSLKVIVEVGSAVHCAYRTSANEKEKFSSFVYGVPFPFASVFHPANV